MKSTILILSLFCVVALEAKPIALIYRGPGSCSASSTTTGCSESAAMVAESAGFEVQYIGTSLPEDLTLFDRASVWIQPGGRARIQVAEMKADLKSKIVEFVSKGKGYVGFCAGGFLATESFGWDQDDGTKYEALGLGLIPGKSHYYDLYDKELNDFLLAKIITVNWQDKARDVYWELGPYFTEENLKSNANYDVIARYPLARLKDQDFQPIMTMRGLYNKGRFYVTAVHPEAPQDWRDYYKLNDKDGLELDLAKEMIVWAAQ